MAYMLAISFQDGLKRGKKAIDKVVKFKNLQNNLTNSFKQRKYRNFKNTEGNKAM